MTRLEGLFVHKPVNLNLRRRGIVSEGLKGLCTLTISGKRPELVLFAL